MSLAASLADGHLQSELDRKSFAGWLTSASCSIEPLNPIFDYRISEPSIRKEIIELTTKRTKSESDTRSLESQADEVLTGEGFQVKTDQPNSSRSRPESGYSSAGVTVITSTGNSRTGTEEHKLYAIRWYVIIVFSLFAMTQYCLWNTFGPIADTVKKGFHWSNADIATLANWDPIIYVFTAMQICWVVEKKGLRVSLLVSIVCTTVASGLRCITSDPQKAKWTMNAGQFLNGLAGTVAQAAAPVISTTWFPPGERTTATAIGSLCATLGMAVSFILGPNVVKISEQQVRLSSNFTSNRSFISSNLSGSITEIAKSKVLRQKVMLLMYYEFVFCLMLLIAIAIYFPDKPPTPPSRSASTVRISFINGLRGVLRMKEYWIAVMVAASTTGIYSGWGAVMAVNFQEYNLGVSQIEAGWIGFYATITGIMGGLFFGRLVDSCFKKMKTVLVLIYITGTISFVWVSLMCINKSIPFALGDLYQACLIGGFCINGSLPILYELVVELTYPIPETVSIGILTLVNNAFTFAFLLLLGIPSLGTKWMNWSLVAVCALSVPLMLVFTNRYKRMEVDVNKPGKSKNSTEHNSNRDSELCMLMLENGKLKHLLNGQRSSESLVVNTSERGAEECNIEFEDQDKVGQADR